MAPTRTLSKADTGLLEAAMASYGKILPAASTDAVLMKFLRVDFII
jgi:hypothetical protein